MASRSFAENQFYTIIAGPDKDASCGLYDPKQHHFLPTVWNGTAVPNWAFLVGWTIPSYFRDGTPDHSAGYAAEVCSANATGQRPGGVNLMGFTRTLAIILSEPRVCEREIWDKLG